MFIYTPGTGANRPISTTNSVCFCFRLDFGANLKLQKANKAGNSNDPECPKPFQMSQVYQLSQLRPGRPAESGSAGFVRMPNRPIIIWCRRANAKVPFDSFTEAVLGRAFRSLEN